LIKYLQIISYSLNDIICKKLKLVKYYIDLR